jgi:DNA-binding IclR family transcriptional regulator
MAAGEGKYAAKSARRILEVIEFLGQGEILEWKSIREVAAGTGVSINMSYRLLETLAAAGWVEKGPRGYRQDLAGMMQRLGNAQSYFNRLGGPKIG